MKDSLKCLYDIKGEKALFHYHPNILSNEELSELKKWLENKTYKEGMCITGKEIPRLQLWYQMENKYFCKEWKCRYERWESNSYDDYLIELQKIISNRVMGILQLHPDITVPKLNSCLVNKYRDGKDSIKPHRDTPQSFGNYPTIIGLSVGDTRKMYLKKVKYNDQNLFSAKEDKFSNINLDIELDDNSLFIMGGASQKYFTHEIPKCNSKLERYSLTFREHIN